MHRLRRGASQQPARARVPRCSTLRRPRRGGDRDTARAVRKVASRCAELNLPHQRAQALELTGNVAPNEPAPREREVSGLLPAGKSNRAVAAELAISERTVEKHVEAILAKLGFSSRSELAARRGRAGASTSSP